MNLSHVNMLAYFDNMLQTKQCGTTCWKENHKVFRTAHLMCYKYTYTLVNKFE